MTTAIAFYLCAMFFDGQRVSPYIEFTDFGTARTAGQMFLADERRRGEDIRTFRSVFRGAGQMDKEIISAFLRVW